MSKKNTNTNNETETVQVSLFGGIVSESEDAPLTFLKVHEMCAEAGDVATLTLTGATYNADRGCLTVMDDDARYALTVYFDNHPDATYATTPNGVRLARAVERCLRVPLGSYEAVEQTIRDHAPLLLTITHTGPKGRLWTVERAA